MKIVLCGFMGCGKSSIGRNLAKKAKYKFIDMDYYIEKKHKMTISEMFAKKGEAFFREVESETLKEILQKDNVIIGTGGGTVINSKNVEIIKANEGKVLFLDVPLAALQERLKRDTKRPLIQRDDRREFIEKLFAQRYDLYKNASDEVIDAGAPINVVTKRIMSVMQ